MTCVVFSFGQKEQALGGVVLKSKARSLSMNDMGTTHWSVLFKKKKELESFFSREILVNLGTNTKASTFGIEIVGNHRSDVDNRVSIVKVFVDCLRKRGIVEDDRPKFFRFCSSWHDESMPINHFEIRFHFKPSL